MPDSVPASNGGRAIADATGTRAWMPAAMMTVVELIAATTTKTGLQVRCELDTNAYAKGIKVTDAEMAALNITGNIFHPEWNYTISPRPPKPLT
jgi:hypothetical protein